MTIEELKQDGYFLQITTDVRRKMKQYEIRKRLTETESLIYCELNRQAYLKAKNEYGLKVVKRDSSFVNFIPFAERNKEKEPLMEITENTKLV